MAALTQTILLASFKWLQNTINLSIYTETKDDEYITSFRFLKQREQTGFGPKNPHPNDKMDAKEIAGQRKT